MPAARPKRMRWAVPTPYARPRPTQEDAQADLKEIGKQVVTDVRAISDSTQAQQEAYWDHWMSYFQEHFNKDGKQIWIQLCKGGVEALEAEKLCKLFLQHYVKYYSIVPRPSLGPDEWEMVQRVTTTVTMCTVWGNLVSQANRIVLKEKRQDDPENADRWTIKYSSSQKQHSNGPVNRVSIWINEVLTPQFGLSRKQTFKKKAATEDDLLLFIKTLWTRSEDIVMSAGDRVAFHTMLVQGGTGGWRTGSLSLRYDQVEVKFVRHPERGPTLIVTSTIIHQKRGALTIEKKQDGSVSYSVPLLSCPQLDAAALLVARALADDAFEAGYIDVHDLFSRPSLQGMDCMVLPWKKEMRRKKIITIDYHRFREIWNRVLLVAGLMEPMHTGALRVGGTGRLRGVLQPSLCNFIVSHSEGVYQRSYQSTELDINLAEIAFKAIDDDHSKLYELMSRCSLRRSEDAPIYPCNAERASWEERPYIQGLLEHRRQLRAEGADEKEISAVTARIHYYLNFLADAAVERDRKEYFKRITRDAGLGKTTNLQPRTRPVSRSPFFRQSVAATHVGRWLDGEGPSCHGKRPEIFIDMLHKFLLGHCQLEPDPGPAVSTSKASLVKQRGKAPGRSISSLAKGERMCLLCQMVFRSGTKRSNLTRHTERLHVKRGAFDVPFPCPECVRQGQEPAVIIDCAAGWCHHVESKHGKIHAPYLPTGTQREQMVACLLCDEHQYPGSTFSRHTNSCHHRPGSGESGGPFLCVPCCRSKKMDDPILGWDKWLEHARDVHGQEGQTGFKLSQAMKSARYWRRYKRSATNAGLDEQQEFVKPDDDEEEEGEGGGDWGEEQAKLSLDDVAEMFEASL